MGGIMNEKIRLHDFQLGRYNCQRFLKNVFMVKKKDAVSSKIFNRTERRERYLDSLDSRLSELPIIPLCGKAKENVPNPVWPQFDEHDRENIKSRIASEMKQRFSKVLSLFVQQFIKSSWLNPRQWVENLAIRFGKYIANRFILQHGEKEIEKALQHFS